MGQFAKDQNYIEVLGNFRKLRCGFKNSLNVDTNN